MTHRLDRGDIIDLLEESITKHLPVTVELDNNHRFEDRVQEIVAQDGEDHVSFSKHDSVLLRKIAKVERAAVPAAGHGPAPDRH